MVELFSGLFDFEIAGQWGCRSNGEGTGTHSPEKVSLVLASVWALLPMANRLSLQTAAPKSGSCLVRQFWGLLNRFLTAARSELYLFKGQPVTPSGAFFDRWVDPAFAYIGGKHFTNFDLRILRQGVVVVCPWSVRQRPCSDRRRGDGDRVSA
jgi:hypothetical protein